MVCKPDSAELPAQCIDLAFLCDTYHHFEFPFKTLASIHQALRQALTQPQRRIAGLQQDRPAVGAGVLLIEPRQQRLGKQFRKQDRLSCGIVAQVKASAVTEVLVVKPFLSQKGPLLFSHSRSVANCSG